MLIINDIKLEHDLRGKSSGRLTALTPVRHNGKVYWVCDCECGGMKKVLPVHLIKETIKSCGCLRVEATHKVTHGQTSSKVEFKRGFGYGHMSRLYGRWSHMKQRCFNPKSMAYGHYGAKGIKVCEEWKNSFQAFYDYIAQTFPNYEELMDLGYQIDRYPDNKGDYAPGNIRFATVSENNKNKPRPDWHEDLTGKVFTRLTVLRVAEKQNRNKKKMWECQCSCGKVLCVSTSLLHNGTTRSCGCLQREETGKRATKWGLSKHPLRNVLVRIIGKCYNPNNPEYHLFGSRGIRVCDEWRDKETGVKTFYDWAIGPGNWQQGLFMDRKDITKDFTPDNCQFIPGDVKRRKQDNSMKLGKPRPKKTT